MAKDTCCKCKIEQPFWKTHHITTKERGFLGRIYKITRYYCEKCLGWE